MPRTAALSRMSITELERLIENRQRELKKLERQRARWQKRVDELDRKIASFGGSAGRRGGSTARARNAVSLPEAIAGVLAKSKRPVAIADIVEGVLASGYRSNSGNFRAVVNQALIKDRRFTSAGRGVYQMRGGSAGAGGSKRRRRGRRGKSKRASGSATATQDQTAAAE